MKSKVIEITVSGTTQTGKSAILAEIKNHLSSKNLAVIYSDRAMRNDPPEDFSASASHEKPNLDRTVIVLNEENVSRR